MKALRIFLQLVILGAGGVTLAALIARPPPEITPIVVFLGLLAVLFALTLFLKEQTEARLSPDHKPNIIPIGIATILVGAFGIFYGTSYLIGTQPLPDGSGKCRAVCGLLLLASQSLGETAARVIAFSLWSSIGLFLCFAGYKAISTKAT